MIPSSFQIVTLSHWYTIHFTSELLSSSKTNKNIVHNTLFTSLLLLCRCAIYLSSRTLSYYVHPVSVSQTKQTNKQNMPLRNNIIGCINFIAVLFSIPIIGAGIWLTTGTVNSCFMLLQWPVIILGILILLVGLAGLIGGFWRITWLLVVYLIAMLALIVLLGVLVGFIYMVTLRGSGRPQPSRAYLEYSLEDFSGFLRRRVHRSYKWERIRSCLSTTSICPDLNQRFTLAQDFFNAYLSPIQVSVF